MNPFDEAPINLFIEGVRISDCITQSFIEERFNEQIDESPQIIIENNFAPFERTYDKMPETFYDFDSWPDSTNLHCWHCGLQFTGMPVFIPLSLEPNTKYKDKFFAKPFGVFSSFACAASFILPRYNLTERVELLNRLNFLHKKMYGRPMQYVDLPDPHDMEMYGGNMSVQEFVSIENELRG